MVDILPGILESNFEDIERKLNLIKPFAKSVHIDLLDGKFTNNKTFFDPIPFKKYSSEFFLELHMMVERPEDIVEDWIKAGFKRVIGQIELMEDSDRFLKTAKASGAEVGLGVDLPTDVSKLDYKNPNNDFLFVMTVKAGFSNQKFDSSALDKVEFLSKNTDLIIEIDGGINSTNIAEGYKSGASRFVSTGFIFSSGDPEHNYKQLLASCSR